LINNHALKLEWSSSWVESELEYSILDLSRIEHILLARASQTSWDFCSSELLELELLFNEMNRTNIFVRANYSSSNFCPTNWIEKTYLFVEHSTRISIYTKISSWASNRELNSRFCSKSWAKQAILFDELNWISNYVRQIDLSIKFCSSSSFELVRVFWF
jgi:hypothetical protein